MYVLIFDLNIKKLKAETYTQRKSEAVSQNEDNNTCQVSIT